MPSHLIFHNSAEKVKILHPRREMKLLTEAPAFLMHPVLFSYLLQWRFPIFAPVLPYGARRFRRCCKSFGNNEAAQTHSCWLVCISVCVSLRVYSIKPELIYLSCVSGCRLSQLRSCTAQIYAQINSYFVKIIFYRPIYSMFNMIRLNIVFLLCFKYFVFNFLWFLYVLFSF